MLLVDKDEKSNPLKLTLSGVIDESTNFSSIIGSASGPVHLYLQNIARINSVGIKLWRDFFKDFRSKGGKPTFFELSPPLVATLGYLSDFIINSEIASICAPYHCGKCNSVTLKVFDIKDAKTAVANTPTTPCAKCQSEATLDEVPEEYLSFLD